MNFLSKDGFDGIRDLKISKNFIRFLRGDKEINFGRIRQTRRKRRGVLKRADRAESGLADSRSVW
ncbi:hypothetical protein CH380_18200 [Leptospira adleri]|uniref:Uncharacterized protein n=1 Tax=Leptospira adleri TaxID=2023186 RepID=A0A2M9YJW3_9LEPT|nr:hypothetical protein CH380_18200 [Leptospira adleri]PJZ62313.1 hypothetical protein CH376_08905 [Leptospira adleri]